MGAEFVRGRVCQGPSLLGAEMSRNRPTWSRIEMTRTISESNHSVGGTSFQNTINQCSGFIFLFFCPTFG